MTTVCTVQDSEVSSTDVSVEGERGWVRLTSFLPSKSTLSLTPSQAMELGMQLIRTGWEQR